MTAAALLAFAGAVCGQPRWRWPEPSRIVVVPDVHGAYAELVGLLRATGMIDASLAWSGGDASLVSLGDLLDRGADSRLVMDLLMRLQREAAARGGAVHVLLGNHEVMNLVGDLRYVSTAEYAAFAAEEPAEVRAAEYERFRARQPAATSAEEARSAFERLYPPGFFARRQAFAADGPYGAWLLSLPAVVVIGETAFVHGGLSDLLATADGGEVNRRIAEQLRGYLAAREALAAAGVLPAEDMRQDLELARAARREPPAGEAAQSAADGPETRALLDTLAAASEAPELDAAGPLWYRGSAYCNPLFERPVLQAALERLGASRVVVGHTPTRDRRARELYDGQLVMLDTGMLVDYYSGRPAALVLEGARVAVQYLAPEERLPLEPGAIEAAGLTEPEIAAVLAEGAIDTQAAEGSRASRRVVVRRAGDTVRARIYVGRAAELELAAHALDRLLGSNLLPPTVARRIDGRTAALQLEYEDAISEAERVEQKAAFEPWCPLGPQVELMYAFDVLTGTTGRTPESVLYRRDGPLLKLVGHEPAFPTEGRVRLRESFVPPAELADALASLDEARLRSTLRPWLEPPQIAALLARRDALLRRRPEQ